MPDYKKYLKGEQKLKVKEANGKQIKPLHGVGQAPILGMDFSYFDYLSAAGIPFSRQHDTYFNLTVPRPFDIPTIFPNFDADENDPASYDFAFADIIAAELVKRDVEIFFRLGVSIENYSYVKAYTIYPPKDFNKWARICEHIIRHYNEGWANGFEYGIRYWEIWNEPESSPDGKYYPPPCGFNQMWLGTDRQFFELYEASSKHLKKRFPEIKVGGYASCGFAILYAEPDGPYWEAAKFYSDYFDKFLTYCREHGCPLDFFSWHNYNSAKEITVCAEYVRKRLDEEGFTNTETSLNEWHCIPEKRGSAEHTVKNTAILLAMQSSPLDTAMFYDARIGVSIYGGLFNPLTKEPFNLYYGFMAFNELYKRKNMLETEICEDGIYALAAKDGDDGCVVIVNTHNDALPLDINVKPKSVREISDDLRYEITEFNGIIKPYSVLEIKF